ncbi:caspase-3-like [Mizuhopecten yessoensis]|nr:caspase-3-like [Mizuhopecten yessoensis]
MSLPTPGATFLGHTEDPSSGYVSSEREKQLPRPPPVYKYTMSAEPRGKCLVVNNQTFKNSQGRTHERKGSNIDADRLMKTFSSLKFETELCNNLSALELVRLLSETGNKDHTNFDCFVLCVLTHGSKGQVIGRDWWEPVDIEELTKYLQSSYCRSLAGKPKIIIIQACQGKKRQLCGDVEEDIVPFAARVLRPTTNTGYHGDTADFVIVNSTCPGYSSLRSPRDGTFFIQTLADALDQHGQRWDFMTILEDVNKKMSRRITRKDGRDYIQTPSLHSTLTAKINFI